MHPQNDKTFIITVLSPLEKHTHLVFVQSGQPQEPTGFYMWRVAHECALTMHVDSCPSMPGRMLVFIRHPALQKGFPLPWKLFYRKTLTFLKVCPVCFSISFVPHRLTRTAVKSMDSSQILQNTCPVMYFDY